MTESDVVSRDYSKFLRENGRLNVNLLPRKVYTSMVKEYRQRDAVINEVFAAKFFLWDLEEAARKAAAEGREATRFDLAWEIFGTMDEKEWWDTMAAIEEHFIEHFHESPGDWAELLDPIYDDLEARGWPAT